MPGAMQLPQEAARLWGDPDKRQQILDLHAANTPLLDMVEALGLTPALLADGLTDAIQNLNDGEVRAIRDAFIAEANKVGSQIGANFPVDCRVDTPGTTVRVTTAPPKNGAVTPIVRIEAP